jgi:hypothetical protein
VRPVWQLQFNQPFSINKSKYKNHLVFSYVNGFFSAIPLPLLSFFLGILYLINAYTSDGQHKEPQQQQRGGQQCEEQ